MFRRVSLIPILGLLGLPLPSLASDESKTSETTLTESFEEGSSKWETTDKGAWKLTTLPDGGQAFELTKKRSDYQPPHRSPLNIALRKDLQFVDFELTARVQTTHPSYGHRDLCFFFGYQDPAHFYYVHLGQATDDHANQIFIVNGAPRTKISTKTTKGTPWKDKHWHDVKIVRQAESGLIKVYFDDMETPAMEATDRTFAHGQIGIGSFDDTGMWDRVVVKGTTVKASKKTELPQS